MSRPSSKKFIANRWMERLVPVILVILVIGLVASILIVILS